MMMLGPLMLGLFKNEKFAYARTALIPSASTSIVLYYIAEELNCIESLDKRFLMYIEGLGSFDIIGICSIDKALLDGNVIEMRSLFHVAKYKGSRLNYEAIIGKDLILYWRLIYDPYLKSVKSLISRPLTRIY